MKPDALFNQNIQAERIILIDEHGTLIGLCTREQALDYAQSVELDLLQVSYHEIPTCRVLDKNKYLYQQQKKNRNARAAGKAHRQKEIKIGTNTAEHDLQTKQKTCRKLLQKGCTVTVSMTLRGREISRPAFYAQRLERFVSSLSDVSVIKRPLHRNDRRMDIILQPK